MEIFTNSLYFSIRRLSKKSAFVIDLLVAFCVHSICTWMLPFSLINEILIYQKKKSKKSAFMVDLPGIKPN